MVGLSLQQNLIPSRFAQCFVLITGTVRVVFKEEGIAAFWKGIGPAWLREASYTSLRLGLYDPVKQVMGVKGDSHFLLKFAAGSIAGGIGSIAGNPFDVLKTKMMATEGTVTPSLAGTASSMYKNLGNENHMVFNL